jgi:hypothetical protein
MDSAPRVPAGVHRWRQALCLTLGLCIGSGMAWATEIYKSVDADGHVTYSDRPTMSNPTVDAGLASEASSDGSSDVADITSSTPPPPLPDADQPSCPEDGDLWTPGYWAWVGGVYTWVPGDWVLPPGVDVFWTPAYWAYAGNVYVFHHGYWGRQVGYYGGINYGFGYPGAGYLGGRWVGHVFLYNRAANHLNASLLHHAYDEPMVSPRSISRASYNGGPGGTRSVPSAQERLAAQSRLHSVSQLIHLQPNPGPAPDIASSSAQTPPAAKPVVSRTQAPSAPRRNTPSAVTSPPANTPGRAAPTAAKTTRSRPAPTIRSISLK